MRTLRIIVRKGRKANLFACSALLCVAWGCSREAKQSCATNASPDTVVCMSYNVENLFDMVHNGSEYDEYVPGRCNWSWDIFERKVENTARVIAAADADIVVLCEIENANALNFLQRELAQMRCRYRYRALGDTPHPTSVCTAILSRRPIVACRFHGIEKLDGRYTRSILEADVDLQSCTLKVFANHWPSKRNPESHRVAAARVLAARLRELSPQTQYILAGDFNANYDEHRTLAGGRLDDTRGVCALTDILRTVTSDSTGQKRHVSESMLISQPDSGWHYDAWLEAEPFRRFCYMYRSSPETPDHFLLPASLYDSRGVEYVDNSFRVFRWNGRLIFDAKPYRWRFVWRRNGKRHTGEGYSDHLPILLRLMVR